MTKPEPIAVAVQCSIEGFDVHVAGIEPRWCLFRDDAETLVATINRAHYLAIAKVLRDLAENQDDACCVGMRGFLRTRAVAIEALRSNPT